MISFKLELIRTWTPFSQNNVKNSRQATSSGGMSALGHHGPLDMFDVGRINHFEEEEKGEERWGGAKEGRRLEREAPVA